MSGIPQAETTVVSAFYPLEKSKHGVGRYMEWIQNFCRIPCALVVFTDPATAPLFRSLREGVGPTEVVERPFDSYRMTSPAMMDMWRRHHALDPEKAIHNPELYAVWAIKQEVVRIAAQQNPFQSKWFVWCDAGIQRHVALQKFYEGFPTKATELCEPGRIAFLEVATIASHYISAWKEKKPCPRPFPSVSLGGGCIAGDKTAWEEFGIVYEQTLSEFDARGEFAGKDQIIFFYMLIERKLQAPYILYKAQQFTNVRDIYWMSFPVILGGAAPAVVDSRFEEAIPIVQRKMNKEAVYCNLMGGLGNQLFEIAAAYAHAKRTGRELCVPPTSYSHPTRRPTYYDSFIPACAKYIRREIFPKPDWREPHFHHAPIPAAARSLYGYFQSSKYFNDCSGEIRELFTPAPSIRAGVVEKYGELLTEDVLQRAVVVHVRRTDYLTAANAQFHAVAGETYFLNAMIEARRRIPKCVFVVFSDDLPWCRGHAMFPKGTHFIDEADDCLALYLMSQFRNYIISNSSFSWWATWLGEPARVVVAPDRWFGPRGPQDWQDIYEPDWILVPVS